MAQLPTGFESLGPFVEHWAAAGESARAEARTSASGEEQARFYHAVLPFMEPALAYLDDRPLNSLSEQDARLMRLMLSLANVYHSVEVLGDAEPETARRRARLRFVDRAPY